MNRIKTVLLLILLLIGVIGLMNSNKKEEKIEVASEPQTQIVLYYANTNTGELSKEIRYVSLSNIQKDLPGTIIHELLKGPTNTELSQTIPAETKVNSIKMEQNKIIVDFSKDFIEEKEEDIKRLQKIYSVVNSLTEINEINEVEILIEGKEYETKQRI